MSTSSTKSSQTSSPPLGSGTPKTACFVFPGASGHINASLALAARLSKQRGWRVHYLSAEVMREAIEDAGATFDDERDAAPELCGDGQDGQDRPGYFEAYDRFRLSECPGSPSWEGRAHCENKFALLKLPGTIAWLERMAPSVVVYCPIWNRVAQLASLVLGIPHVSVVTIAGFGGFHKILADFIGKEGATIEEFRSLYETSPSNQHAIDELCAPPYDLDRSLFAHGAPPYYFGTEPPYAATLGRDNLVTTIPSLRDPVVQDFGVEEELYAACGVRLNYVGPLVGVPGQLRATTFKAVFTEAEQDLHDGQSHSKHRRRSDLCPVPGHEDIVDIVRRAKDRGRRLVLVSLGTVVTSDRAGFGWKGTGLGESITGKELVESVVNGVLDVAGLPRASLLSSVKLDADDSNVKLDADDSEHCLVVCAVGQQPDALDGVDLPPNALCRASIPQVDILRCMEPGDCFVQHGGENSTMEGLTFGVPMVVCPTFSDQPVNAAKLANLGVGVKVDRPTTSGAAAVAGYRRKVGDAVRAILHDTSGAFSDAAIRLQKQVAASGGEAEAETIFLRALMERN